MHIRFADRPADIPVIRALFLEYAASIPHDLCFQDFQHELGSLPGRYAPPAGRLLVAEENGEAGGCVALRMISPGVCEMKRLYVRQAFRGKGVGRELAERLVSEARAAGYDRMRLDTMPTMTAAVALYRQMGFREIASYRSNPVEGAIFMELELAGRQVCAGDPPGASWCGPTAGDSRGSSGGSS